MDLVGEGLVTLGGPSEHVELPLVTNHRVTVPSGDGTVRSLAPQNMLGADSGLQVRSGH